MIKRDVSIAFFFGLLILFLYGVVEILTPFAGALLTAFCLAITFYPFYEWMRRRMSKRGASFVSILTVLAIVVFLVVPLGLLVWMIVLEAQTLSPAIRSWGNAVQQLREGNIGASIPWIDHVRLWAHHNLGLAPAEFQRRLASAAGGILGAIASFGAQAAQHALDFLFHLLVMLFALFFFLRDGASMRDQAAGLIPLPARDTESLLQRVSDIIVGVVRGWFLTSLLQGVSATSAYLIVGLPGSVLLGVLTAVVGLLPVVGTMGVWIPVSVYLLINASLWKGIFVFCWGAFIVVGVIDTVVRPYLVGRRADISLLPLFFALLGGVEVFGVKGIILGPLLVAVTPLLLEIFRRRYHRAPGI